MRFTVGTSDEGTFTIEDFDPESALDFKTALNDPETDRFLTLDMDGATVLLNRDHIVSVEFDYE